MENKLKNWMHKNQVKAITLARRTGVTRQTIAKLINNDFVQIDRFSLRKVKAVTGLTYDELLSDGESGQYHRRTGIHKLDKVVENLLHDLHDPKVEDKYQRYIADNFYCSSPHYLSTPTNTDLEDISEGEQILSFIVQKGSEERQAVLSKMKTEGWVNWSEMCLLNAYTNTKGHSKYIVIDSIDMIGNYRRIDKYNRIQVTARSVFWDGSYSITHATTLVDIKLDKNFGEIMSGEDWKIKSWLWYNINTEQI